METAWETRIVCKPAGHLPTKDCVTTAAVPLTCAFSRLKLTDYFCQSMQININAIYTHNVDLLSREKENVATSKPATKSFA